MKILIWASIIYEINELLYHVLNNPRNLPVFYLGGLMYATLTFALLFSSQPLAALIIGSLMLMRTISNTKFTALLDTVVCLFLLSYLLKVI
jgi:hypothetical protein